MPPYRGTTRHGIGIGSTRIEVNGAYGRPDSVVSANHTFCFGEKHLTFIIHADTVASMSIGYAIPARDGFYTYCK